MTSNELPNEQVVVGLIGAPDSPTRDAIVVATELAGAIAELWTEATAIARAETVDIIVFDGGTSPGRFLPVAATLGGDPRTSGVPRFVVLEGDPPVSAIVELGAVPILSGVPGALAVALGRAVESAKARREADTRARVDNAERRSAESTLSSVKKEGATLSHDARVLFGVILGYAANLRDGFAGPVTEQQRTQLENIVEASNDASGLLDRYITGLRRSIEPPPGHRPPSTIPRVPARRHHNDLGELVRGTVALFEGIAAAKRIALAVDAPRSTFAWCDAMQIKQALVNLIANALKFTPPDGRVDVALRLGPPPSAREGTNARRDIELVVTDSGPGIPEEDRERVFERGVRLDRDKGRPGTGIGLAVVRDVADAHSGMARVEAGVTGGAAFVLTLPTDLRSRGTDRRPNGFTPSPVPVIGNEAPGSFAGGEPE